ncbi:MAG: prolyl oligopeptidase family serine peptidase [Flavobacteriaceae bacterium]|nr:prolyl oligopeptidase family serine peptidase [Flavobacteriaceae bacterium]
MKTTVNFFLIIFLLIGINPINAQKNETSKLLSLDRIHSDEFKQEYQRSIQWVEKGNSYITIEKSKTLEGSDELLKWNSTTQKRTVLVSAKALTLNNKPLPIEGFSLSPDESKILIFTNSSRVWRSNTKGDYWVYDLDSKILKQIGKKFITSSLMFAKFSIDNKYVAYVQGFNIYKEDFSTGEIQQLTFDGNGGVINGTFDWVYEEEFGKRDGFSWSPNAEHIAFWQLDASKTGIFYMINNTDSIYSKPIPLHYPKVGQPPSSAKVGVINAKTNKIEWVKLEGGERENYIPGIQWLNNDLLLLQQMNRKQNQLIVWSYQPSTKKLSKIYTENEETWIELIYPDISSNNWGNNDLQIVDGGNSFLRMTENDAWRHVYKVDIASGKKILITPGEYDIASVKQITKKELYFIASPNNSTQRYLYRTNLKGSRDPIRLTPETKKGVNNYNISPNGKYAIHTHESTKNPKTVSFISLPNHKTIKTLVANTIYSEQLTKLATPEVRFSTVSIADGIEIDVRMILPLDFDATKKYPVLFHVYGEPWGQVAVDKQIGLWNIFLAQKGYVIIDMDNRGTPCLKGSAWRKSIYRKIGLLNTHDQAAAAKELLKLDYLDAERTAVWGWSGGGSMTLNLMFQFPEIYKTGMAIAAVSNQLIYDNIYQERYMGIPQENRDDFINGSPITYAKNLEGNLLIIHGTGDDNVHYQSAEMLINELIKHNKQFQVMPYPNRSHGINEGENTRKHLFTLLTNYLFTNTPPNK